MKTVFLGSLLALFALASAQVAHAQDTINAAENAPGYWVPAAPSPVYDYPPTSGYDAGPPPGYYNGPGPAYYGPGYYGPPVGIYFGFGFHSHHH